MVAVQSGGDWGTKKGRMLWVESLLREPPRRPAADKVQDEYLYVGCRLCGYLEVRAEVDQARRTILPPGSKLYFSRARNLNRTQSTVDRIGNIVIEKSAAGRGVVLGVNIPPWFQFADVS